MDVRNPDQQLSVGDKTPSFAEMISNYCTCIADLCQLCIELLAFCFCSSQGPIFSPVTHKFMLRLGCIKDR